MGETSLGPVTMSFHLAQFPAGGESGPLVDVGQNQSSGSQISGWQDLCHLRDWGMREDWI